MAHLAARFLNGHQPEKSNIGAFLGEQLLLDCVRVAPRVREIFLVVPAHIIDTLRTTETSVSQFVLVHVLRPCCRQIT